ncbi:virulence RhuM family protein, partial [Klebsiella michiganensis]|nr:virulence RhuM family protein [Klebsiella michiganensis]
LPVILAVGYRVRSPRGTQFRQWATQTLQEYLIKGFVMDDERLKNPPVGSSAVPDYFDEMLERIRDIRASERLVYLRVREIIAYCSRLSAGRRLARPTRCEIIFGPVSFPQSCAAWRLVRQSQLL